MEVPEALLYTSEHEWVAIDENVAAVGITDYAQSELGDIVFVELPKIGDDTQYMEPFGTIESVKATNDLFSPVSGQVAAVNSALKDEPTLVNKDPYGEGWMIAIKMSDPSEVDLLISAQEYQALTSG
ncbi:MAG: glycine cleavage system protein GcvH [bacterium]